jgi:hypothetical protein
MGVNWASHAGPIRVLDKVSSMKTAEITKGHHSKRQFFLQTLGRWQRGVV